MSKFSYRVEVDAATQDQADQVMEERLGPEEDYGFNYTVDYKSTGEAPTPGEYDATDDDPFGNDDPYNLDPADMGPAVGTVEYAAMLETMAEETTAAIDTLTNPTQTETIIQIPVSFWAHYENGEITKLVVSPLESYAGYFGGGSFLWDGPVIDLSDQGEFWEAMRDFLIPPDGAQGRSIVKVHWEE